MKTLFLTRLLARSQQSDLRRVVLSALIGESAEEEGPMLPGRLTSRNGTFSKSRRRVSITQVGRSPVDQ